MVKVTKIRVVKVQEIRGRPSWLIPMIKDMKIGDGAPLPDDIEFNVKYVRSNVSIWGKRHNKRFAVRIAEDERYYVTRTA